MFSDIFRPIFRDPFRAAFSGGGGWVPPAAIYPAIWSLTDGGYYLQRSAVGRTLGKVGGSAGGSWRSARASSGIAGGKISTRFTVAGSSTNVIVGISTSSATMQDFLGQDAHGIGYLASTGDVLRNGSPIANLGTYSATAVVQMDVDFVAKTVAFIVDGSSRGSVSFAALSGTVYPSGAVYDTGTLTIDCGQSGFTPSSGFTAGPVGPWSGWLAPDPYDVWLHDDATGLWTDYLYSGFANVVGYPVGAWRGGLDQYELANSASAARLEHQADGVLLNSTGVIKYLYATISRDPTLPFYAAARMINVSGQTPRFNTTTAAAPGTGITGISASGGTKQRGIVRGTNTQTTADFAGPDKTQVVWFDGTLGWALDSDGVVTSMTIGAAVATIERLQIRALNTENAIATIKCVQFGYGVLDETIARNIKYWMDNYP